MIKSGQCQQSDPFPRRLEEYCSKFYTENSEENNDILRE